MIYVKWECDKCGIGGKSFPFDKELSTIAEVAEMLLDAGWLVGEHIYCPDCKKSIYEVWDERELAAFKILKNLKKENEK